MAANRPKGVLRWFYRVPVYLYRWHCGWLLGTRFLLLTHMGRRTGRRHHTVLEAAEYRREGPEVVVMSAYGPHADWFRNIQATPAVEIAVGAHRFAAAYRVLEEDEALRVVAGYERRNRLIAPIIRSVMSRFLGWRYHGAEAERRRLVAQLPLVAFRPRSTSARAG